MIQQENKGSTARDLESLGSLSFDDQVDVLIWEFPKIRGTLFWGPYNKDPTI